MVAGYEQQQLLLVSSKKNNKNMSQSVCQTINSNGSVCVSETMPMQPCVGYIMGFFSVYLWFNNPTTELHQQQKKKRYTAFLRK